MRHSINNAFATLWISIMVMVILGCGGVENQPSELIKVVTTTNIVKDWVKNVGGIDVYVHSLVSETTDPHTFKPTPKDIKHIEESDIVFLIGQDYEEHWLKDLSANVVADAGKLVYLSESVELRSYSGEDHGANNEEDTEQRNNNTEYQNDKGLHDPHFWHDPLAVADAVEKITWELSKIDSTKQIDFESNANTYIVKLTELDKWIVSQVNRIPSHNRLLITNHETMGYFAERYKFEIIGSITPSLSSKKTVTPKDVISIIRKIEAKGVKTIFGEPQMSDRIANAVLDDTGVTVLEIHTESLRPASNDADNYIGLMKTNVDIIVGGLIE